ncbi:hypothetical protein BBB02_02985 [Wolbachia endosymbiont of Bemisia tabaci]|uniref:hypothetical protein n=1 Tax=Wolbachia endosymbiont of Bemisia tabaci TaxID=215173 RepID=UPI000FD176D7|nr:hypothetical protein [Wolbachia endosymbiont of Bemisia tabaci]AZU37514.1 hypothetical protein BBB02_02985 [Wolbachia endosymbiont of Bemisia tabaci]
MSVGYVHTILDKLVKDLNDTFVPELNIVLKDNQESMDLWFNDIDRVEGLVTDNRDNIGILKESFNNVKKKKLKN